MDGITRTLALHVRGTQGDNRLIEESGINVASQGLISLQRTLCEKSLSLTRRGTASRPGNTSFL